MSRVGKRPVAIPSGVTASVEGQTVKMKGPKGQLQFVVHDDVEVKFEDGAVKVANISVYLEGMLAVRLEHVQQHAHQVICKPSNIDFLIAGSDHFIGKARDLREQLPGRCRVQNRGYRR